MPTRRIGKAHHAHAHTPARTPAPSPGPSAIARKGNSKTTAPAHRKGACANRAGVHNRTMPDKPAGPVDENRAYAILPQREARGRIREGVLCCAAAVSLRARHKHAPTTRRIGRRGSAADRDSTAPEKHAPAKRRERGEENRRGKMSHPAPCPETIAQGGQCRCALFSPRPFGLVSFGTT